jgi:hypothetical protein
MAEEVKGARGAPSDSGGVEAESNAQTEHSASSERTSSKDVVNYDTYRKLLSEKKRLEEKFHDMDSQLRTLTDEKLSAEGKTAELLDTTKKRLTETEMRYKKAVGAFAFKSISGAVEREALKLGCTNVNDLVQLCDLSEIDVDDDFQVNMEQVKDLVERQRKDREYLFSRNKMPPRTGAGVPSAHNAPVDWKTLPLSEQAKMIFMNKK